MSVEFVPNKTYWVAEDGSVFEESSDGEEYLAVDDIGKMLKLKKIGKLKKVLLVEEKKE